MNTYTVYQSGRLLAHEVAVADSFLARFRGLMLRKSLSPGAGLLLKNCSAIHCLFMRFPIDVVYLNRDQRIVAIETVKPWRLGGIFPGAKHVLELNAGSARNLVPGMRLEWKEYITT